MPAERLEYRGGGESLFREIEVIDNRIRTRYGKIGNKGRTSINEYRTPSKAQTIAEATIAELIEQGYMPVGTVLGHSELLMARAEGEPATSDVAMAAVADQMLRLEAAMLHQTRFSSEEFEQLRTNPLLTSIVRHLVWVSHGSDATMTAFRIAEDASLADVDDAAMELGTVSVTLPRSQDLEPAERVRWSELFADYELVQPFDQLGRHQLRLEYQQGTSSKYWEVEVVGQRLLTSWGRIGTKGQSKVKKMKSAADALAAAEARTADKIANGYKIVRNP